MKVKIERFIERRRQIAAAERALEDLPKTVCASEPLRRISEHDLLSIFTSTGIGDQWEKAQAALAFTGSIEDGKTDGVNPGDRRALWYLVKHFGPTSVLEIGTNVGASTVHIAHAMQSVARRDTFSKPCLVTVDIEDVNSDVSGEWKKRGLTASPGQMIQSVGCKQVVSFVTEASLSYLDNCEAKFDLIFLDGDHASAAVYQEIPRALNLLNEEGLILLHDYFPGNRPLWSNNVIVPGPYTAVTRLRKEGAPIKVIPLGGLPWDTKQGSKTTSLAVLTRDG